MAETLALFDLDSTLIDGDCEIIWCDFLFKFKLVDPAFMRQVKRYCVEYEIGKLDYVEFEHYILSPVADKSPAQVQQLSVEYLQHIRSLIRPRMSAVLDDHRRQGHTLLLATASNNFLAEPIAALLQIPNVVCTHIEMQDGIPNGRVIGKPAFREGKVERIKEWVAARQISLAGSWGYSDSHNDIPLLSLVEHPVAVSPDAQMRLMARQKGWRIIEKAELAVR